MVNCPACKANIDVEEDELDEGESLACDECGANFKVAGLNPLDLEPIEEEEGDEEDEDDKEDKGDEGGDEDEKWH